jgi:predicted transcriptional regulator
MSDMSETVSFRIPPELRRELRRLCKAQKRPVSDVAREALRRYLAAEELRVLREKLRPYAEARGFLTDEDVFKAVS